VAPTAVRVARLPFSNDRLKLRPSSSISLTAIHELADARFLSKSVILQSPNGDVTQPKHPRGHPHNMIIQHVAAVHSRSPENRAVPLPQRYARALRWAKKVAAELPDISLLVQMARTEKNLRQG
jgi:hypothetical protein